MVAVAPVCVGESITATEKIVYLTKTVVQGRVLHLSRCVLKLMGLYI